VTGNLRHGFRKVIVIFEFCFLLFKFFLDLGSHDTQLFDLGAQVLTIRCIIGQFFSENITGAIDCRFRISKPFLFREINATNLFGSVGGFFLSEDNPGERFQTEFLGNGSTSPLLGLVRSIKVFEERFLFAGLNSRFQLWSELTLFFNTLENRFFTFLNFLQIFTPVLNIAKFDSLSVPV
jgi:hypothetical protein